MSMNPAFNTPTIGSAPFDEMAQRQDNAETPDTNADPEGSDVRMQAQILASKLPEGFYVDFDRNQRPIARPTLAAIKHLGDMTAEFYAAREAREQQMEPDKSLNRALTSVYNNLHETNEFVANGFVYGLARDASKQVCNAMRWVEIHAQATSRRRDNGNEDGAEESLINFENSKAQALKNAQLLDWCADRGVEFNFENAARDALSLAGWQLSNSGNVTNRQAIRQNTMEMMFDQTSES